jgi:hypothetical protein
MAALHQHRFLQHTRLAGRQSEQFNVSNSRLLKLTSCSGGGIEPSLSCSSSNNSTLKAGALRTIDMDALHTELTLRLYHALQGHASGSWHVQASAESAAAADEQWQQLLLARAQLLSLTTMTALHTT